MAITYIKKPQKYSPSGNPVLFQIESNNVNLLYFKVEVKDASSGSIISTSKAYPTPATPKATAFNLQSILDSLVNEEMVNSNAICIGVKKPIKGYRLKISEVGTNGNGTILEDINDIFYIWDAELNDTSFNYYTSNEFVITAGKVINFLSNKPNNSYINFWSTEYLYFIDTPTSALQSVEIKTYTEGGLKASYSHTIVKGTDNMFRLNISPKALTYSLAVNFTDVKYYTVQLLNNVGVALSELKYYNCIDVRCSTEPVNLIWKNEYGGFDSFTFINPIETQSITKSKYTRYSYQLNDAGIYSTINNNIKNKEEVTINSKSESQYTVTTEAIDDVEFSWLMYILQSKSVYVECSDGVIYPIQIDNTSKQVLRRKYSKSLLRFDLSYTTVSGLNASPNELARFNNRVSQIGIIYNIPAFSSSGFYTTLIGDTTTKFFTVTHNLNSTKLNIQLLYEANGNIIQGDITIINNNQITVEFAVAPTSNQVRVNINKMI